ncbi:MAG: RHS repeat domain-containing protein, partial [Desulfovibrionaceae bacterium]
MNYGQQELPFSMQIERDSKGKIIRKIERVRGREPRPLAYTYDEGGRLTGVDTALGQIETYLYENGLRVEAQSVEPQFAYVRFAYTTDDKGDVRLANLGGSKGRAMVEHDDAGHRILVERRAASEHYRYADGRLLAMRREVRGEPPLVVEYAHDGQGGRAAKYVNGQLAEMYEWADALRLARVRTGRADMEFGYRENARIPFAMSLNGRTLYLFYDQVGSPRVVADERGNVVQETRYDSFGRVVESSGALTDAGITLPIGFAGGLYDPDLGQCGYVRFGLRDYDPFTGRFTAKDPLGYAAGDDDLYGYCLDDPVNAVDPTGMQSLEYDGNYLKWYDAEGKETDAWNATSGPFGNGALPDGNYTGWNFRTRTKNGMVCPDGDGWSVDIEPEEENGRTELRIHPDGGKKKGTMGCIGIQCGESSSAREKLEEHLKENKTI